MILKKKDGNIIFLRINTKEYNKVLYKAFRKYGIENFSFFGAN